MVVVAFLGILISLAVFAVVGSLGSAQHKTRSDLFSTPSLLNRSQIARANLAANVGIAGGIEWFLTWGGSTSLWIVIWGPLMVSIGLYLNAIFVDKFAPQEIFDKYSSMSSLTEIIFNSRVVSFFVLAVTALGSLTILIIEMHVGIQVFNVFFPNAVASQGIATFVLMAIITCYAAVGGLAGNVRNDIVQNILITSIIIVFVIFALNIPGGAFNNTRSIPFSPGAFGETSSALIVWLVVVNFTFIPTQLRFWQLAGSSRDRESFVSGIKISAIQTGVVWSIIALAGYAITLQTGQEYRHLSDLMRGLASGSSNPLFQVAFVVISLAAFAALVSTMDSSLISLSQLVSDNFFSKYRSASSGRVVICAVGVLVFALYAFVFGVFGEDAAVAVFISAFSFFILTAPLLVVGMMSRATALTPLFHAIGLTGLMIAVIVVMIGTYSSIRFPEWAGTFGLIIATAGAVIGHVVARKFGRTNS